MAIDVPELERRPQSPAGVFIVAAIEKVPERVLKKDASFAPSPRYATVEG